MSYQEEFQTVELIKSSCAETRGVDAFALALIKAERQMRKLVTHLVFQFPCFSDSDISYLREALAKRRVYFEGLKGGFESIYPKSVQELVGESYDRLFGLINKSIGYRNKIFHGQLTGKDLSREGLFGYVDGIKEWCGLLSNAAELEIGYNGFARNSFQKSSRLDIYESYKRQFSSVQDYESFIKDVMERKKK